MTAKKNVVLLDQSQIGPILKHGSVASLDAIAGSEAGCPLRFGAGSLEMM